MNELRRIGKAGEYLEMLIDYDTLDSEKMENFLWWFQEIVAGDKYTNKDLLEAVTKFKQTLEQITTNEE